MNRSRWSSELSVLKLKLEYCTKTLKISTMQALMRLVAAPKIFRTAEKAASCDTSRLKILLLIMI